MLQRIPWYYMWSPRYEVFHRVLQTQFHESTELSHHFSDRPLFFEQSFFSKELTEEKGIHPFVGSSVKIELVLQALENNRGNYILFTDVDIIVLKEEMLFEKLKPYMDNDYDMVYLSEDKAMSSANIGFCFLFANDRVIDFWKQVKQAMTSSSHDQGVVNSLLPSFQGSWCLFDEQDFLLSNRLPKNSDTGDAVILQVLSEIGNRDIELLQKIRFYGVFFCNFEKFRYLVSDDIWAFIQKDIQTLECQE